VDGHATMALCGSDANDINPHAQELCHEGMTRLVMCDAYPFRVGQLVHPATRFRRLPSSASRSFFSAWFKVWVRPNDPALLLPKGGEWKGIPPRREGVWFEGLMMGDDGFLQERPRWRVFCSKQCSTQHTVTKDTLEARASAVVSEGRRTI
jgi:hypothetical protein